MQIPLDLPPSIIFGGLFYLLIFRLAVILLGGICIYLGYRLFILALPERSKAAEFEAKAGDKSLSLKNAAPGTFFALFGALITIVILSGNPPEFKVQQSQEHKNDKAVKTTSVGMRGESNASADAAVLHNQIWSGYDKTLQLAKSAVDNAPDSPALKAQYLDTLAGLYFFDGKIAEAIRFQMQATQLMPNNESLKNKLKTYQSAQNPTAKN